MNCLCELGIFGMFIPGHVNEYGGYLLRVKPAVSDEGGTLTIPIYRCYIYRVNIVIKLSTFYIYKYSHDNYKTYLLLL